MRRLLGGIAAVLLLAACGTDKSTAPPTPTLTTAQLAMYYDSLAGALSPSDPRIHWLQEIDEALAFGAARTPIVIDVEGAPNLYWAVATATIGPPGAGQPGEIDSTYVLAAWLGDLKPTSFLQLTITYVRESSGLGDTAEAQVVVYADSTASGVAGTETVGAVQDVAVLDACTPIHLVNLYTPTGTCSTMSLEIGYQSSINGMPFRAMFGTRFMPSQ
jgi:hypothetical protein